MSSIYVFTSKTTLEGNNEFGDIEVEEGEVMDIQEVKPPAGPYCMYQAILAAANDKGLLHGATVDAIKEGINSTASKRQKAKDVISKLELPACICIETGDGHAVIDYNQNIVDGSDTFFILERSVVGGIHYDWLKRGGAAAGGRAGGASLALRF